MNAIVLSLRRMQSDALGVHVRDGLVGVAQKLVELKPYIEELWRRFDNGDKILGCSTKKEFCEDVLHRSPRAIRYMLAGGNPDNVRQQPAEIISPRDITKLYPNINEGRTVRFLLHLRKVGDHVTGAMLERLMWLRVEDDYKATWKEEIDLTVAIEKRVCGRYDRTEENPDGVSHSEYFGAAGA